jgi:hypothetical protein
MHVVTSSRARSAFLIAAAASLVLGAGVQITQAGDETVRTELSVVYIGSPASPDLHLMSRNASDKKQALRLMIYGLNSCSLPLGARVWQDVRLGGRASLELDKGAWFVLSVPSGVGIENPPEGCSFEASVEIATGERWVPLTTVKERLEVPAVKQEVTREAGNFRVETSVIEERFGHGHASGGGVERFLQAQIFVENNSAQWRRVSITGRKLQCSGGGEFEWLLGADEAISGLSSGPAEIAPGRWTAFSQRLGGRGDSVKCEVSFTLGELRRGLQPGRREIREFRRIEVKLDPSVRVQY